MKIELTKFIHSLTMALDFVEEEIIKVARNHGKRVAVMVNRMAVQAGLDEDTVFTLTQAAVLHDCALSEYLNDELNGENGSLDERNMAEHCIVGERMLMKLPVYHAIQGSVLYHHERADGKGAMGKTVEETPLTAQLIHMADLADVTFSLDSMNPEKYEKLLAWLECVRGTAVSEESAELFLKVADYEMLSSIAGEGCRAVLLTMLPQFMDEISTEVLREMASFFAKITDYKSHFTWRHSIGIAEKAERMGEFYGYDRDLRDKLYIAGALHDLGKLLISNEILEKPGKLTSGEYREIQNHAMGTWKLLSNIGGLEEISRWAALHHEKLDGSGYPFGYTEEELSDNERLLACLDIYQALVEERPYKAGLSHREAMEILNKMGREGQLDQKILKDLDACFSPNITEEKVPSEKEEPLFDGDAWRCPVCGYIYEGELPQNFICPRCEQPGTIFEKTGKGIPKGE